jgi:3-hydroxy-2-methylpyridine-4,5-dicarboxylate 4-decarboxylase
MSRISRVTPVSAVVGIALTFLLSSFVIPPEIKAQAKFDPKATTAKEAVELVVLANRILSNEGIFDYLGHVSARNPENPKTFFIARSLAPESVTRDDILEVDLEANIVTKTTMQPYSERVIHSAIYKARPDVNAALHAHPLPIIAISVVDVPIRPVANFAREFYQGVPVYDEYDFTSPGNTGMLVTTKEEGDRVARVLGNRTVMLMRGHGFNAVGASVPELVISAVALRDNVLLQMMALQLGKPKYMADHEAKGLGKSASGTERGWNYFVSRAKKAFPDLR